MNEINHWNHARMLLVAASLAASVSPASAATPDLTVRVINPQDVEPLIREDFVFSRDGKAVHRRVVSKPKDGSVSIDAGYNTYKTGVGANEPYAYDKDELCYFASGEMELESDGVVVIARPGNFMWRPAGAPTHRTKVTQDTVTICAFGPARNDAWSHKLATADIDKWNKSERERPRVRYYDYRYTLPTSAPDGSGQVVHRPVVSASKDGAVHIDANHTFYPAGASFGEYRHGRAEVCWFEAGSMELVSGGVEARVHAGQFLYRPAGASTESAKVLEDTIAICFFGPARTALESESLAP